MLMHVIVAVRDAVLRKRLIKIVTAPDVQVEIIEEKRFFWKQVRRKICDVLIVSRDLIPGEIPEEIGRLKDLPEAPLIIAVGDTETPEERAQFIAAGFDIILEIQVGTRKLKKIFDTILNKKRQVVYKLIAAPTEEPKTLLDGFVARSSTMKKFLKEARQAVRTNSVILILGETGVGKERLAHAIHNQSTRSEHPFIAVNCGAFPETLLESELFGHEEGAFTGASKAHRGCFELAHTGTLFLDEIGEMPMHLQAKLLRVLEDKSIKRLGGEKPLTVDVRIIAATNRDLESEMQDKQFRKDLYYRLNVFALTVPPLRDRREDIPELAQSFIDYISTRIGSFVTKIDKQSVQKLSGYHWPGNVRELFNVLERAMLLCEDETITADILPLHFDTGHLVPDESHPAGGEKQEILRLNEGWPERPLKEVRREMCQQFELKYLSRLLRMTEGKVSEAARRAGINQRALYTKMKQYGLSKEDYHKET